jgi:glycosyltransferase involved in cell wall biosynthesis
MTADFSPSTSWRIALCPPEFQPFQDACNGFPADATYLLQKHIASGLINQGHRLTYLAQRELGITVCTTDVQQTTVASQTWSRRRWLTLLHTILWRLQQRLGIPYLNLFSNLQLLDACMQCLPGHDLVYERNALYRNGIAKACKRLRLPYVLFVEADEVMEYDFREEPITGLLRWRAKNMIAYNLKAADCIVCVSEPLKEHLHIEWRIPQKKIVVFPNGVDVQQFRPDAEKRTAVRASLDISDRPMLLFVGNFYEWHDVKTLLDAVSEVLVSHPNAYLVLAGDGHQRQAMEHHAARLGIMDNIRFLGRVPHADVPGLINAADIAIVPVPATIKNMWLSPLKLFEYMAAGAAIISSRIGHLSEVIRDGENGLLVAPGDPGALASAAGKLLGNEQLRLSLGAQARTDALRKHSWDSYFRRLERVFHAVITGKPVCQL